MKLYIHRNPTARGFGFSIHKEGCIVIEWRLWHLSGYLYRGTLTFMDDVWRKQLDAAKARITELEAQLSTT